jgi:CRP-like cAMP-binding protein
MNPLAVDHGKAEEGRTMDRNADASNLISLEGSEPLIRKLTAAGPLTDRDIQVIERSHIRKVARDTDLFSEGDSVDDILFLREGWAYRYRLLGDGRRQVVNFLVPGDLVGPITPTAKQFVATLTDSMIHRLSRHNLADAMTDCPGISAAVESLIAAEYAQLAERTVSLGRRNAKERMAHFLLELFERLDRVGLVVENSFELPLTQEMIGDALGLSVVHVNRTLRTLREEGLATVGYGRATIHDVEALSVVAESEDGSHIPHEEVTGIIGNCGETPETDTCS